MDKDVQGKDMNRNTPFSFTKWEKVLHPYLIRISIPALTEIWLDASHVSSVKGFRGQELQRESDRESSAVIERGY